jgi:hypothetical protein
MRPRKPSSAELHLIKENDSLRTTIVCLRRQIEDKQGAVGRLEILLRERLTRIDHLTAQVEQLRDQNRRLDVENQLLAGMVQLRPETSLQA